MKLLLVQLSDIHCQSSDHNLFTKIDKAVDALCSLTPVDDVILVFSGDLTNNASNEQFKIGQDILERFLSKLAQGLNCKPIPTLIVPGNHDMVLPSDSRTAHDINGWNKDEHLSEELNRLSSFFEYAKTKDCFQTEQIVDVVTKKYDKFCFQFYLINSAPYSTREKEDKQLHYLPSYVGEKLSESVLENTIRILICHHSHEWFDWETKEMLKRAFIYSDIIFFGHDHQAESILISNGSTQNINIIMGGQFAPNCSLSSAFNALLFDSDSLDFKYFEFVWKIPEQIFTYKSKATIPYRQPGFSPSKKYLEKLLMNNEQPNTNLLDYFVFPKLIPTGNVFSNDSTEEIDIDDIFDTLNFEKAIKIVGRDRSGKTSLLKYLYTESIIRGYFPILIEKKDYKDSKIEKMFRDMIEEQYECLGNYTAESYNQKSHSHQIIFIDDIDLIQSEKARTNLIDYVLSSGRLLVYSVRNSVENLEEVVKERLQGKDTCSFEIPPFYKESRDALIENICKIKNKSLADKASIIVALDYLIQCQSGFFSLDPGSLLQYINYFMNKSTREGKGIETLSLVFETNIRNAILAHLGNENINVVLSALEYLADHMYFKLRSELIEVHIYVKIIEDFNRRRKAAINVKKLLEICQKSHILQEEETSFNIRFSDKNTFAYFVAKYISREYERDASNMTKLLYVMNHICFGINDTIVLFLAFIRSNTKIVLDIAAKSIELLQSYQEWDFEKNNIPFLTLSSNQNINVPTLEDTKAAKKQTEQIEKERLESVKFQGIFDYADEDVNKEHIKILTALKYAQLVGRALIDQYGMLEASEINQILQTLYTVPQRIIYAILMPYQKHHDTMVKSLKRFVEKEIPEDNITEDEIKIELANAGTILALNILNDIAYNASNSSTIIALRDIKASTMNYKIMQLMMEENVGNTEEFVSKAISLHDDLEKNPYAKMLIAKIARKHILYSSYINHRQIDRLISGNIISPKGKKMLIAEQGSKVKE